MRRLATLLAALGMLGLSAQVAAASPDLEDWFTRDLVPYVRQQLATLPRFRDESFRFVIMREDRPQSEGSALALALRDRLRDAVSTVPGIRVAWQGDRPGVGLADSSAPIDCSLTEADYLIGLELTETAPGRLAIRVRALDIAERSFVPGFERTWSGAPGPAERRNLRVILSDPSFRGERDAPWDHAEADLMAAHLAYDLGCKLMGQTAGEYVVAADAGTDPGEDTLAIAELVSNNLANLKALRISPGEANAVIEGKAHRIDEELFQYWVTVTPTDSGGEMTAISADAYVRIPDVYQAAALVPEEYAELGEAAGGFLSDFSLVRLGRDEVCETRRTWVSGAYTRDQSGGDCYALLLEATDDAVVFFLYHQLGFGLVRLSDERCSDRSTARIARRDKLIRQALPVDTLQSQSWSAATGWAISPRADTYYVIAATDTAASRALSGHVGKLPRRCTASARQGLEGQALRDWLEALDEIAEHGSGSVDWRSIRVKEIY